LPGLLGELSADGANIGVVTTVSERDRPYHHGNLRNALVDAGVELATESGPSAILLREAARRVGVSHNAGYRHFAGREELVAAVAERGMAQLAAAMTAALAAVPLDVGMGASDRARARLRAIGRAYVAFALAEPGLFRTAFSAGSVRVAEQPTQWEGAAPYAILGAVVDEFVAAGLMPAASRAQSEVVAWSAVQGLATLLLDGPLRDLPNDQAATALDRLCDVIQDGFSTF